MGYIHTAVPDPATRGMLFAVGVVSVLFVGEAICELTDRIWKYLWEDDEEEDGEEDGEED